MSAIHDNNFFGEKKMELKINLNNKEIAQPVRTGSSVHGYWMYHSAIVSYDVEINGLMFNLAYSNGDYKFNDYNCNSNEFDVCNINSSDFIYNLSCLYESDFADTLDLENSSVERMLESMKDAGLSLSNDELYDLYIKIQETRPAINDLLDDDCDEFKIKSIDKAQNGFLKVEFSHGIIKSVKAKDEDEFWSEIEELENTDEDWRLFKRFFYRHENEDVVDSFFN